MKRMPLLVLVIVMLASIAHGVVVDSVTFGDGASESAHELAAKDATQLPPRKSVAADATLKVGPRSTVVIYGGGASR
jgi:hypothetical protein